MDAAFLRSTDCACKRLMVMRLFPITLCFRNTQIGFHRLIRTNVSTSKTQCRKNAWLSRMCKPAFSGKWQSGLKNCCPIPMHFPRCFAFWSNYVVFHTRKWTNVSTFKAQCRKRMRKQDVSTHLLRVSSSFKFKDMLFAIRFHFLKRNFLIRKRSLDKICNDAMQKNNLKRILINHSKPRSALKNLNSLKNIL